MRYLLAGLAGSLLAASLLIACGARSSLPVDAVRETDDAGPDAPPTPKSCVDEGITFIYLLTSQRDLLSFYPPDGTFKTIGPVGCSDMDPNGPFSMAVARKGTAYAVYEDGRLFKISTKDASCSGTSFLPSQQGFSTFGMGFAADGPGSETETLFVAEGHPGGGGPSLGLGTIDTSSFELNVVGPFGGDVGTGGELTGTGDGRLFTYFIDPGGNGSHIAEIDKTSAAVLSDVTFPFGDGTSAFAFAFWGGKFYIFTAANGGSTLVNRYDPADGSVFPVAMTDETIVGAGVSTCAPE